MANLIPLNLDKDTGEIVARGGIPPGRVGTGYLYEQLVPAATWTIPHNGNSDRVLVQIYDETGEFTLPNEILILDINNIEVNFNTPMVGTAHIMFFSSI